MRVLSDDEVAEEASFIEKETHWPLWPVLPVKNVNRGGLNHPKDEEIGIMVAGHGPKVYLIGLYDLEGGPITAQLEGIRALVFGSLRELVEAGWIGD